MSAPIPEGVKFTQIVDGSYHAAALGDDGNAYAWGWNDHGQLGDGTKTNNWGLPRLMLMPAGITFTQVNVGDHHSIALGDDGSTYAWGSNNRGQLGDGNTVGSSVPVFVDVPTGVQLTDIGTGDSHTLALADDGKVYAWGWNGSGRLGIGNITDSRVPVPVRVPDGVTFAQVDGGANHSVALDDAGNAYAWGNKSNGKLGDGGAASSSVPVPVSMPAGVKFTHVAAGYAHSVALGDDGVAYVWGSNDAGQLGDGSAVKTSTVPVSVVMPAGVKFTELDSGRRHVMALGDDGNAYAWGWNGVGQLGNGDDIDQHVPTLATMPAGVKFTQIGAGGSSSVAFGDDGNAYEWGGDGSDLDSSVPVLANLPDPGKVVVTAVLFDGVAGTSLADAGDGSVSVVTPMHAPGSVDVTMEWSLDGVAQTPTVHAAGYTYIAATPVLTDPSDVTCVAGEEATFSVAATDAPLVGWEVSTDEGASWQAATGVMSADGLSLTVACASTASGNLFRAVATNSDEQGTSAAAKLTVTSVGTNDDTSDSGATADASASVSSDAGADADAKASAGAAAGASGAAEATGTTASNGNASAPGGTPSNTVAPAKSGLAATGGPNLAITGISAFVLMVAGGVALLVRRRATL